MGGTPKSSDVVLWLLLFPDTFPALSRAAFPLGELQIYLYKKQLGGSLFIFFLFGCSKLVYYINKVALRVPEMAASFLLMAYRESLVSEQSKVI